MLRRSHLCIRFVFNYSTECFGVYLVPHFCACWLASQCNRHLSGIVRITALLILLRNVLAYRWFWFTLYTSWRHSNWPEILWNPTSLRASVCRIFGQIMIVLGKTGMRFCLMLKDEFVVHIYIYIYIYIISIFPMLMYILAKSNL